MLRSFLVLAIACVPLALWGTFSRQSGTTGGYAAAPDDLGDPIPGLNDADDDLFYRGRRLFRWELWRPETGSSGFNETECSACHREPYFGGSNEKKDTYAAFVADDKHVTAFRPFQKFQRGSSRFQRVTPPADATFRRAPALFGMGLLEAVPIPDMLANGDAMEKKYGVSGRLLKVGKDYGRFGWKGHIPSIEAFTIDAFKTEMGMTVSSFERQDFGAGLGSSQIKAVTHYIKTLGPPKRPILNADEKRGSSLFEKIQCASCHTPTLTTGKSTIAVMSEKKIMPYSDMLLHEMGKGDPKYAGSKVGVTEFRTTPLWGLGSFTGPYMHDGRSATVEEAIKAHDGEAKKSREEYEKLSAKDKAAILGFLKKL